jgi:hypothetical protein
MSATAGAISIQTRSRSVSGWRVATMVAVLGAAAVSGVVAGGATAPTASIPAVAPHVETGAIHSTRPLSDSTFRVGEDPAGPRSDTPAGVHARQVAP